MKISFATTVLVVFASISPAATSTTTSRDVIVLAGQNKNRDAPNLNAAHRVEKNVGRGETLILEDGSSWALDPLDQTVAMR